MAVLVSDGLLAAMLRDVNSQVQDAGQVSTVSVCCGFGRGLDGICHASLACTPDSHLLWRYELTRCCSMCPSSYSAALLFRAQRC